MKILDLRRLAAVAAVMAGLAACGGKAVFVEGGAGGAGADGTAGPPRATTAETVGESVGATATVATGPATASVSAAQSSTATGPVSLCDGQGDCGDSASGCIGCALAGECADEYGDCAADQGCIDYASCIGSCGDAACRALCADQSPAGAALYAKLVVCALCEQCAQDCDAASLPECGGVAPPPPPPPACDGTGDCGDSSSGCLGCALADACADAYQTCVRDQACIDYSTCLGACQDDVCVEDCAAALPDGAVLYNDLVFCVICEQCYEDCDGAGSGCP
jgi:hypothetical protein